MTNLLDFKGFNESAEHAAYETFIELQEKEISEGSSTGSVDNKNSPTYKALKNKAKKSGFPLGILKQVFKRGKSAWARGHVPGTVPNQWGFARVNSFIVGGRTTEVGDGALYKQAKKAKAAKKKNN
jgi:hypothetical protein